MSVFVEIPNHDTNSASNIRIKLCVGKTRFYNDVELNHKNRMNVGGGKGLVFIG